LVTVKNARDYPKAWLFVSAAWLVPAILAMFENYMHARLAGRPVGMANLAFQSSDWFLYAFLTPIVFALARRYPIGSARLPSRIAIHFAAALVLCLAWASGGVVLGRVLFGSESWVHLPDWFFTSLPFGVAVYFCVLGVAHGIAWLTQASRLSDQLAQARLSALRMQMHPHFLYNSLNAITVVMRDRDLPTAVRMMEQLGEMLHHVIRTDRPQEIPLRDEIAFVRQYLALEAMRFPDRLDPVYTLDPAVMGAMVPDLVLQPLVENAIRHGLAVRAEATRLEIAARREGNTLVLTVSDDGPGPQAPADAEPRASSGIGLANTRERLATLYGAEGRLDLARNPGGGTLVTVRIPWRESGETGRPA
jgi:two-component system LytT family sensor kinase